MGSLLLFQVVSSVVFVISSASQPTRTASYVYSEHAPSTVNRYPTPLPKTRHLNGTYGPAFNKVSHLLPLNATTTTYSLDRDATGEGEYGQSAFAALWKGLSFTNTVPFTTTPAATPIPSSELVFPPPLYQPCNQATSCLDSYRLPKSFMWGVSSSAWQSEGGMLSGGRGPSGLDIVGVLPPGGAAPPTPAIANDSVIASMGYYLYKQDIARLAAIGIPYYSFSISWTRVVPFGKVGSPINQEALDHYDDVINTCLEYGVTPIVTLWHFDAPFRISPKSPEFPDAFLYYAKQVLARYASRVPVWQTLNEPNLSFVFGTKYFNNLYMLKAHTSVYRWYKDVLKGTGRMSLKFSNNIAIPKTSSAEDNRAALRYQEFYLGILGNPLFLGKDFPDEVLSTKDLGLPSLSKQELEYYNGSIDFFSVDPYTAQYASAPEGGIDACAANLTHPLYPICVVTSDTQSNGWINGNAGSSYVYLTPQYFRTAMTYIWETFRPSGILITEFGFNPFDEHLRSGDAQRFDLDRTLYYQSFLSEVLKLIHLDGVNMIGALAWTITDNNEFGSYNLHFGLQSVNRTEGPQFLERTYKRSIFDFVDFFQKHM